MTDNELHVVFGTGPVGMAIMDELVSKGKRVRMVNRGGRADVADGIEVVGGDAADPHSPGRSSCGGVGRLLRPQPTLRQVARVVPVAAGREWSRAPRAPGRSS